MIIGQLSEVIYVLYNNGRVSATNKALSSQDVHELVKMTIGTILKRNYYNNRKTNDGSELAQLSSILSLKRFPLSEATDVGKRFADLGNTDLYILPRNSHITNVYPIGCGFEQGATIPQVQAGEENFYITPEFNFYKFFVVKGKKIDTYHIPDCVKEIEIEASFNDDEVDISLDVCYEVSMEVLGVVLKLPDYQTDIDNPYSAAQKELKQRFVQQKQQ